MLISMTGFGSACTREQGYVISTEIKAVNNRFLKTSIRLPDGFAKLETKIEEILRERIARGSVNFTLKVDREVSGADCEFNFVALKSLVEGLVRFQRENPDLTESVPIGNLVDFARLPGVLIDKTRETDGEIADVLWDAVACNIRASLDKLQRMREVEGEATQRYLADALDEARMFIDKVKELAPGVAENYRLRLTEKVARILRENGVEVDSVDVIREVAVFTDRVDVSEEIARFYSHLDQFGSTMRNEPICGKKLDFITQEMFREANTIGSKANSPDVLAVVVQIKATVERIREMVQNVE